jgi:hypothetical protein
MFRVKGELWHTWESLSANFKGGKITHLKVGIQSVWDGKAWDQLALEKNWPNPLETNNVV